MKELIITKTDEGRRLDKFLSAVLVNCASSFIYRMLRKKNIVLNDRKASGNEKLVTGDSVRLYFSDESFDKFTRKDSPADVHMKMPPIIYEDGDIIIIDKPAGMLSQKAAGDDISVNEICISYMRDKGELSEDAINTFTPSICNRLDRNTSGLMTFAKTYTAARVLSEAFRRHDLQKYYECIAVGRIEEDIILGGTLIKDPVRNKVTISDDENGAAVRTIIHPIRNGKDLCRLQILLITGKTHQIRAHLASIGHPILGDMKYGNKEINDQYRRSHGIRNQMLTCTRLIFPDDTELSGIAGKTFEIQAPGTFEKVM